MRFKAKIESCVSVSPIPETGKDYLWFYFSRGRIHFSSRQANDTYFLNHFEGCPFKDKAPYTLTQAYNNDREKDMWLIDINTACKSYISTDWFNGLKLQWIHKFTWLQQGATKGKIYWGISGFLLSLISTALLAVFSGVLSVEKKCVKTIQIKKIDTIYEVFKATKQQQHIFDSIEGNRKLDSALQINPYHIPETEKGNTDVRFILYDGSKDLEFLYTTVQVYKIAGADKKEIGSFNIAAKESPLYLSGGNYELVITTKDYEPFTERFSITEEYKNKKISLELHLKKKRI